MSESGTEPVPAAGCLAVIIPNWNGRELMARCLAALAGQTWRAFETVVVDNGSDDGSVAWLERAYPQVRIVALDHNQGFAAACNAGIRATAAALIVTLNNDTLPQPGWLEALVTAAQNHPEVGMFAGVLWQERDLPVVDAAGLEVNRLGVAWNTGLGQAAGTLPAVPFEVFGPCGGAALYRRALLDDVGLFDESYFAYLEDVELAWRARWAGWCCLAVPGAVAWHAHSATGGRVPARKLWLLGRNRLWTLARHYPRPCLWAYLPLIVLNEGLTGLLASLSLRSLAPLRGRLAARRRSSPPAALRRLSAREMMRQLKPIPSPAKIYRQYREARRVQEG